MAVDDAAGVLRGDARTTPSATWPYKMDKHRGLRGEPADHRHQAREPAHLRGRAARREVQRGMGTTIVVLFAVEDGVYVAHVGDTRVYRFRDGKLEQLTEDHSLLNDYIKMKRLTARGDRELPAQERDRARARA